MKTIYSKFSRERHPNFQLLTSIKKSEIGEIVVEKKALSTDSVPHLIEIVRNFEFLSANYPHHRYTAASLISKDIVRFDYIKGASLDSRIWRSVKEKDLPLLLSILKDYVDYLKTFNLIKLDRFQANEIFLEVFDCDPEFSDVLCMTEANIDLTFDNILIDDSDSALSLIDYEWIFETPIPVDYIIYRSVKRIYWKFGEYLNGMVDIDDIFASLEIREMDKYQLMEEGFQRYVLGKNRSFSIGKQYWKNRILISDLETKSVQLEQQLEEQVDRCNLAKQKVNELTSQINIADQTLKALEKTAEKEKLEKKRLLNESLVLNQKIYELTIKLENSQRENTVLQDSYNDLQKKTEEKITNSLLRKSSLLSSISLLFRAKSFKKEIEYLLKDFKDGLLDHKDQIIDLKISELEKLNQYLQDTERKMSEFASLNEKNRLEVNHLKVNFKELSERHHLTYHQYNLLKDDYKHLLESFSEINKLYEALQVQHHNLNYEHNQLKKQLFLSDVREEEDN